MSESTFTRSPEFARWIQMVGASARSRRSSLPEDKPVYRI